MSKKAILIILITSFYGIFFPSSAFSALQWEPTAGPYGGQVTAVTVSTSGAQYIGTSCGGIYRSVGGTWEPKYNGISDPTVVISDMTVLSAPSFEKDVVFAVTSGKGIWKSTDGGQTWQDASLGIGDGYVYRIALDQVTGKLFAATRTGGLRKSSNYGQSWENTGFPATLEPYSIDLVAVGSGPARRSFLYVGTELFGIFRSTDEGSTWLNLTQSYPAIQGRLIYDIAVAPSSPEVIYASVASNTEIYKSTDEGASWVARDVPGARQIIDIVVDPISGEVVYGADYSGGIQKTVNGGASWINYAVNGHFSSARGYRISIDPTLRNKLYLTNLQSGFFNSESFGQTWVMSSEGINNLYTRALLIISAEPTSIIYAGTDRCGIFRSSDEGAAWVPVNSGVLIDDAICCFAADPRDANKVLAGILNGYAASRKLLITTNGGTSWTLSGFAPGLIYDMAFDPNDSNVIYAAASSGEAKCYRSTDGGSSWSAWADGMDNNYAMSSIIAINTTAGTVIHTGGYKDNRYVMAYRRGSLEASWTEEKKGLVEWINYLTTFAEDHATAEGLYYGGANFNLYNKVSSSNTWELTCPFGTYVKDVASSPNDPTNVYCSLANGDIWRVGDYGNIKLREMAGLPKLLPSYVANAQYPISTDARSGALYASVPVRSVWKARVVSLATPNAPSAFSGVAASTSEIDWSWLDNSYNEQGFRFCDSLGGIVTTLEGAGITSWEEASLSPNLRYGRSIKAYNTAGESSSLPSYVYTLASVPGAPVATNVGRDEISFSWEANGNPSTTTYNVWRATPEAFFEPPPAKYDLLGTVSTTEFTDTAGLSFEAYYWYKISAINGDLIATISGEARSFLTLPPVPSEDIYPPKITNVRFDGRAYFENDIIYRSPRIQAKITDYASLEPTFVTPEGVDRGSVRVTFGNWVFENISQDAFSTVTPTIEMLNFLLPQSLGPLNYLCTIEARDRAYPYHNRGVWTGPVRVLGDKVSIMGIPLAYPAPYKPMSGGQVTFAYTLSTNADVIFYMFDVSGQVILTKKFSPGAAGGKAGYNSFSWNGRTDFGRVVGNGLYVYKLISGGHVIGTGKLVVLD